MDKIILGDNSFFAVNHISDEKARALAIRFAKDDAIMKVLDDAVDLGINTFMCTTYERIGAICRIMKAQPGRYANFNFYPCMPYAHKYANAVTEHGILGTLKQYVPGNLISTFTKGGFAFLNKDFSKLMEILVDAEMKMFKDVSTPVIFIQNAVVDLILGLKMHQFFVDYDAYIRKKYDAEPGYITMNMPMLLDVLNSVGIYNPVICTSVNKIGFRMAGGQQLHEKYLLEKEFRPIAMQVLAAGALKPEEAIAYVAKFPKIESVLFGASSKAHIQETKELIERYVI